MKIIDWLKLPETMEVKDLDDPATSVLHARILQKKKFLRNLYIDFYTELKSLLVESDGKFLVELGSGGGFIKELIPNVVTSDIRELPNVDKVLSASQMPFDDNSVDGFVMLDVLHHLSDLRGFFREAQRCLKDGGKVIMIEPASTVWSRFVYKNFHHEDFDAKAGWSVKQGGPLSGGNAALAWIIFSRDRDIFEKEFSKLQIIRIRVHTPFAYLLSGGFTVRQLVPSCTYGAVRLVEHLLSPANRFLGMFQTIELQKIG